MGEIAEMMLDGTLCERCGGIIDGTTPGFPRLCEDCNKLYKTLTEIKEIAEYHNANAYCNSKVDMRKIL